MPTIASIRTSKKFLFVAILSLAEHAAFAWGERGHHVICEMATRLVQNPKLAAFLLGRGHLMGHVCNIPDIHWRGLGEAAKSGEYGHFINSEKLDLSILKIPEDFGELLEKFEGKTTNYSSKPLHVSDDVGSLWWRADQMFRLAIEAGKKVPKLAEGATATPEYDRGIFEMMTYMGLLGHFAGDVSMPYHSSADHDGWKAGRGGIHAYYETDCVNALGPELELLVYRTAAKHPREPRGRSPYQSVVGRMKRVSAISYSEIGKLEHLDRVSTPSKEKTKAVRPAPADQAPRFEPLIVREMARSALLLAEFWDDIYEQAGQPDFSRYKSYRYPLAPDFVPLDYLDKPAPKAVAPTPSVPATGL